ncbi:MAG: FAD-dependent oxidoreductase [Synechococcaceae cyanobacterium]
MIVGAGPAGLALALALAERNLPVTLVEASRAAHGAVRGEALMPSGLAAIDALGLAPLPTGVPRRRLSGWSFQIEGRELFSWPEPEAPEPGCTLIDQRALLQAWRQRALALPQLTLLEGVAAVELLDRPAAEGGLEEASASSLPGGGTAAIGGVRLADGRRLGADLVVACDGRGSLLRQRSGLRCPTRSESQEVLWFLLNGAGVEPLERWLAGRFVTVVGPGAAYALFERAAGGVQLGLLQPAGQPLPCQTPASWRDRWAAAAPAALAQLLGSLEADTIDGPQRLPVPVGCAERWQRPGLLLLGDAAHPMSPLRAQGLNMALRDALTAAQLLLPQLRQGDAKGLETALTRLELARQREVRAIQALQRREARLGQLLQRAPALRLLLAANASWSGPLLAQRWAAAQRTLREGVLALAPLG